MPRRAMTPEERGKRLRALREAREMSQETVAARIGVRARTISAWETGARTKRGPRLQDLIALADLFEVSVDFLLGRAK